MQYHFTDSEVAKYVRKMCTLQSSFYKEQHGENSTQESQQNNNLIQVSSQQGYHGQGGGGGMMRNMNLMLPLPFPQMEGQGQGQLFFPQAPAPDLIAPTLSGPQGAGNSFYQPPPPLIMGT